MCTLDLFFGRDSELEIYHENFLLVDNKHGKLFVIKQTKKCKFMHTKVRLAAGLRLDPQGDCVPPDLLAAMGGLLRRGGREAEGATSKGDGREGREERGDGKGGEGNSPQSQCE